MKLTAIAKAALALGILTTGTLTTEVHSGHAKQNQKSVNKHDKEALYRYYTGKTMEMKNISALKHGKTTYVLSLEVLRFKFYCLEMIKVNFNSVVMRVRCFLCSRKRDKHDIFYTVGGVIQNNKTSGVVSAPILNVTKGKR